MPKNLEKRFSKNEIWREKIFQENYHLKTAYPISIKNISLERVLLDFFISLG